ncbi:transcriptional regulator [Bailinhaonella thermotolerans]|uniref:Transcriptional regulator n=1 Tax=Bailinhaonella thermotolerans TaxID=1070861 RepID=A0A3A4AR71_9ACTN|nr:transcriptional regulator [Bailinhaonella thermotolerans]RJL32256.1 transcriptional regulator [Bailinhaonella thermotolerans]
MLMGHGSVPVPCRLVAAAYRDEQEAADKVVKLGAGVDVCLFASPLPYDFARRSGVLSVPATYVPLGGAALHAALSRAVRDERLDLTRVSVDVIERAEVEEAYSDLGLSADGVQTRDEPGAVGTLTNFHERLFRRGATTGALTCLPAVAERLEAAGVPAVLVRPTTSSIRGALHSAALMGAHHRLEESQLTVVLVDVPTLREPVRRSAPRYWRDELRLALHRLLVQEGHRMQASVWPIDDHSYLVSATRGSVSGATDGFRVPPFAGRVREELGLTVEVGIGMGRTTHDAEAHARAALSRAQTSKQAQSFAVDREGRPLVPAPRLPPQPTGQPKPRGLEVLSRLAAKLEGGDTVVDAEAAGRMLGVTPRTARRLLRTLVDEGLAWPLPPNRTPQPGRPRQLYRLIIEKLGPARA